MAGIQEASCLAFGTAVKETIFIAGGIGSAGNDLQTCEVYSTLTNEWQFQHDSSTLDGKYGLCN